MRWLVLLTFSLVALPIGFASPAAAADVGLETDADGPMFSNRKLSPRYASTRCVRVSWSDNDVPRLLGVAANVSGGLAPHLHIRVEAGSGGGYATCRGFDGVPVYDGTLAAFGAAHPSPAEQLTVRRIAEAAGSVTFRISVEMSDTNRAQGRSASADFIFAVPEESPRPEPPAPDPTTPPAEPPPPEPSPTPTLEASTPVSSVSPSPSPPPTAKLPAPDANAEGPAVSVPLTPQRKPKSTARKVLDAVVLAPLRAAGEVAAAAVETVEKSAKPVAKGVAWSVWTFPVMGLFLALQHSIDARDPKLAQAPAYADPSLPFDDCYTATPDGSRVPA